MRADRLPVMIAAPAALLWAVPFVWMVVASLRPAYAPDIASLWPTGPLSVDNIVEAWADGSFPRWYFNTVLLCGGILLVQIVTVSMAGYAFARLKFPGERIVFGAFLLQLLLVPTLLIVPNLSTLSAIGLYDTLVGVAAPYLASAFGVFLMRQTFRAIPREYEEAAVLDGAGWFQIIVRILLPLARPGLAAFAVVSITSHWNEFLWPLMVIASPRNQVLTVGLASFASGSEAGGAWGVLAAGTLLVAGPLLVGFLMSQRVFARSFLFAGIK
jgi:sn-glycerol 3-phosphate transport system permease protein